LAPKPFWCHNFGSNDGGTVLPDPKTERQMATREILDHDEEFVHSLTFREQCARAFQILRVDQGERFSLRLVASLLAVDKATMQGHWKKFTKWGNEHRDGGRPAILTPEIMDQLVMAITEARAQERPLSLHQIRAMIDQVSYSIWMKWGTSDGQIEGKSTAIFPPLTHQKRCYFRCHGQGNGSL
jgi:hypothetical protein